MITFFVDYIDPKSSPTEKSCKSKDDELVVDVHEDAMLCFLFTDNSRPPNPIGINSDTFDLNSPKIQQPL